MIKKGGKEILLNMITLQVNKFSFESQSKCLDRFCVTKGLRKSHKN